MRFSARYDTTTRAVSAVCVVLLLGIATASRSLIAAPLSLLVLALAYGFSPTGYSISGGCIVVRRLFGAVRIPLDGVRMVRAATPDDFRGCLRLFGSGGLFGYYGKFRTQALGTCTWYLTDRGTAVVVSSSTGTVLVSPEDVNGFLSTVQSAQPSVQTAAGLDPRSIAPIQPTPGFPTKWVVLITVAALAVAFSAMFYSPGAPSVDVAGATVTIHDRFHTVTLRADQIDLERVRIVDLDSEPGWRPTLKVHGFSNPFYHSGLFHTANGQTADFFAGRAPRLVLLPPKGPGTPVLFESQQPEKLATAIARLL